MWVLRGGIIAPVGIGSFIFLANFYFIPTSSILFIVLLQFTPLIVGWDLNVWVLWDNWSRWNGVVYSGNLLLLLLKYVYAWTEDERGNVKYHFRCCCCIMLDKMLGPPRWSRLDPAEGFKVLLCLYRSCRRILGPSRSCWRSFKASLGPAEGF